MKIKAFTLVELAVVMLISIILFGIAYFSWQIIEQRFISYTDSSIELENIATFKLQIEQDFKKSTQIIAGPNSKGILVRCENDSTRIEYLFTIENILRTQATRVDTFKIISNNLKMYLLNEEILKLPAIIDEITFSATYNNELLHFNSSKKYSASDLLDAGL